MNLNELKDLVINNSNLLSEAEKIRDKNKENYSNFMKLDYICSKLNESYNITYCILLDKFFKGDENELNKFIKQN